MRVSANGDRKFVAHLPAERADLGEAQVIGVAWPPPTDEAGLGGNELEVRLVSISPRLPNRQHALVDATGCGSRLRRTRALAAAGLETADRGLGTKEGLAGSGASGDAVRAAPTRRRLLDALLHEALAPAEARERATE